MATISEWSRARRQNSAALVDGFSGLADPRQAGNVVSPWDEIMLVVLHVEFERTLIAPLALYWRSWRALKACSQFRPSKCDSS